MPMRIGGLASGLDIDQIVSDLMKAERTRTDKVTQEKTLLEWTRTSYTDVNKLFAEFILKTRELFGLTDSSSGSVVNKSVGSLKWIKSAGIADSGIADVSARSDAVTGSYGLNVQQLAANWSAASSGGITVEGGNNTNLASQFGLSETDVVNFTITSKSGSDTKTVQVYVDKETAKIKIGENDTITLEGKNISNLSLKEVANQITKADTGVTAFYDESIDRFFIQTNQAGEENTVSFTDSSELHDGDGNPATFLGKLNLEYDAVGVDGDGNPTVTPTKVSLSTPEHPVTYTGQNAIFDFGAAKGISKSSNQFTVNNIDINLKAVGATTIKVDADEDTIVQKVKEFANLYNEMIDQMDKVLGEKRYKDFPPLTAEQKKGMTDKEIELWEEKAKSGLLRNDSLVSGVMRNARTGLYEKVEGITGSFDQLTKIGITTEQYVSGSMGGRLEIDESKLRSAIREDLDGVVELLFKEPDPSITGDAEKRKNTGLIGRMYGDMVSGMKEIIVKAGPGGDAQVYRKVNATMLLDFVVEHSSISMLDESISDYEDKIYELQRRLADKEESYWKKFSAMEVALNKMNSQSSWISQQLGMGSGGY